MRVAAPGQRSGLRTARLPSSVTLPHDAIPVVPAGDRPRRLPRVGVATEGDRQAGHMRRGAVAVGPGHPGQCDRGRQCDQRRGDDLLHPFSTIQSPAALTSSCQRGQVVTTSTPILYPASWGDRLFAPITLNASGISAKALIRALPSWISVASSVSQMSCALSGIACAGLASAMPAAATPARASVMIVFFMMFPLGCVD